jgi:hypothetical protein
VRPPTACGFVEYDYYGFDTRSNGFVKSRSHVLRALMARSLPDHAAITIRASTRRAKPTLRRARR